jgi:hypothetical protein
MKKVILILFVTLLFQGSNKACGNENLLPDWPKVTITVEIGMPITCANGLGVCRIDIGIQFLAGTAEVLQAASDGGVGHGGGGGGGGSWMISIPRENMVKYYPNYLSKFDGQKTVTFEDSYAVPANVRKELGVANEIVIRGHVAYPLKFENGEYIITMPL